MIEFGKTLREAREAKGYTVAQLAELTRLKHSTVTDLENEDFSHIAAPIYGRGFVKLYCEAVGLDPKPLVAEYMAITNGEREPVLRERPVTEDPVPAERTAPPAEPVSAAEPPPAENTVFPAPPVATAERTVPADDFAPVEATEPPLPDDGFRLEAETRPASAVQPSPFSAEESPFPPPQTDRGRTISRYATPLRECMQDAARTPALRLALLGAVALALLVAIGFGLRTLYRATSATPPPPSDRASPPSHEAGPETSVRTDNRLPTPDAENRTPRTAQKLPDLYID